MPIIIPKTIPAYSILSDEFVNVMEPQRARTQDIRPLKIALLNLMPTKIETETQILRMLSNSPLQVTMTFLYPATHQAQNTPESHLFEFYTTFDHIKNQNFDGLIVTGAPLEQLAYQDVSYWDELQTIFSYANTHVTSTLCLCWGAFARAFTDYRIPKTLRTQKCFGVFSHTVEKQDALLRGINPVLKIPHSCHAVLDEDALRHHPDLEVLVSSPETGPVIFKSKDNRNIFITGHLEYDQGTLDQEYRRDLKKGLSIAPPFYEQDVPRFDWRSDGTLIFTNWLNYYVYQETPYNLDTLNQKEVL